MTCCVITFFGVVVLRTCNTYARAGNGGRGPSAVRAATCTVLRLDHGAYDLTGPESADLDRSACVFSKAFGRPISDTVTLHSRRGTEAFDRRGLLNEWKGGGAHVGECSH